MQILSDNKHSEGDDPPELCTKNTRVSYSDRRSFPPGGCSQAALAAGKLKTAQMWMLMSTALTERIRSPPPTPLRSPLTRVASLTCHSRQTMGTPTQPSPAYKFPPSASLSRSPDVPRPRGSPRQLPIAFERSSNYTHRSPSMSNQRCPYSSASNSSSPL